MPAADASLRGFISHGPGTRPRKSDTAAWFASPVNAGWTTPTSAARTRMASLSRNSRAWLSPWPVSVMRKCSRRPAATSMSKSSRATSRSMRRDRIR